MVLAMIEIVAISSIHLPERYIVIGPENRAA
jgi:hypothetical protein